MEIHSPSHIIRPALVVLLFALVQGRAVHGAVPNAPGAGSILQQVQPATPLSPAPEARLSIDREGRDLLPTSAPFLVKTIRISGNTLFDTATLHALVAEAEGKNLTLSQLGEQVARITAYYHAHGYPLAQAVILAQVIEAGVLVIDVIEARYGEIALDNSSRVKSSLLQSTLSPLERGQFISEAELNHALLLLSDIPGLAVDATLKPGETVGSSDLEVHTISGPAYSGSVTLDDYGNRTSGKMRVSAIVNVINPLNHGDILTVAGLSSGGGTNHGRLAYESLLNGEGTRMGGSYSTLHYILGEPFASLGAHGTAQVKTLWVKTPFTRSRKFNLHGLLQYDALQLRDRIDAGDVQNYRHLGKGTVGLAGDARDSFLSSAITMWGLGWKTGRVTFDDAAAQAADAATAGTHGEFSKWNVDVSRLQSLGAQTELFLSFSGQWGSTNLDASEKITAGGPYTVRAYDVGAVAGDSGGVGTAEVRRNLGSIFNVRWQGVVFVDYAQVKINHTTWADGVNSVTLGGAGVGFNCTTSKNWSASFSLAARIGSVPSMLTNAASARAWFEINRGF